MPAESAYGFETAKSFLHCLRMEAAMHFQPSGESSTFRKACHGDKEALEVLIEFLGPRLHQWIGRFCSDCLGEETDDVYQETWLLLIKDECRILRRYQPEKGDLGAFLLGVARNVAIRRRADRARSKVSLSKLRGHQLPVSDSNIQQTIEDLSMRASFAEKRFLRECLLGQPSQESTHSKTNRWQLSHRLFNKLWPLVYGPEVPRPTPRRHSPSRSGPTNSSKPKRLS